jgi:hypothetical protein
MTIHLRTETDHCGDAVDYHWYCSGGCYDASFIPDCPKCCQPVWDLPFGSKLAKCWGCGTAFETMTDDDDDKLEIGGAYPCGAESDSPDYCATCEAPIGNPLTSEGEQYVREYVCDVLSTDPEDESTEHIARAGELAREYAYLFH